jgi:serine/threonine protein kinase/tetratricopeptide (TPR) repeat protein
VCGASFETLVPVAVAPDPDAWETVSASRVPAPAPVVEPPRRLLAAGRAETAGLPLPMVAGYEVLGIVGRGAMGVVYRARHLALNRVVALKMILSGPHAQPDERTRFRKEAVAVARLQHPHIVQIFEVGEQDGRPFLALEFVAGGTLQRALNGKPQPARWAAEVVETLARAMHHAHQQGIVHRDLKPGNILLQGIHHKDTKDTKEDEEGQPKGKPAFGPSGPLGLCGESLSPKITDFGLAKQLDLDQSQTQSGVIAGTPSYMAPEQASGQTRAVGPAADVYALGAILYECLTGRPPFLAATSLETLLQVQSVEPVSPRRLQPGCPTDLETICLKCLDKQPRRRYATALDLAEDLCRFLEHRPIVACPAGVLYRFAKFARRHRALVGGVACVFLALVLGIIGTGIGLLRARAEQTRAQKAEQETRRLLAESYEHAARLAMQRGAWRGALDNLDRALAAGREDSAELHLLRVKAWSALDDVSRAWQELQELSRRSDLGHLEGPVLLWQADLALCLSSDDEKNLEQVRRAVRRGLPPAEAAYAAGLLADTSPRAAEHFLRAVQEDPFHQRGNSMLILLWTYLGQFDRARERLAFAELVFPDDPTFKVLRAQLHVLAEDDLERGYAVLNQARGPLDDRRLSTARSLVALLYRLRRMKGLAAGDGGSAWLQDLGGVLAGAAVLSDLQRPVRAAGGPPLTSSGLLLPIPPVLFKALRRLPGALELATRLALGDYRGLGQTLSEALRIHPDGLLYLAQGQMLGLQDRWAEAEIAFLAAAQTPSIVAVRRPALFAAMEAAWVLAHQERSSPEIARRNRLFSCRGQLGAVLASAPSGPLHVLPPLFFEAEGPRQRALGHARKLVALGGLRVDQMPHLTVVALQMDDLDLARRLVSEWQRQAPGDLIALRRRAAVELKGGAYGRALEAADAVLKALPGDPQALRLRGQALEQIRKQAESLKAGDKRPPGEK